MSNEDKIRKEFADAAGFLASRLSLSPTAGQIYGLLYMSPDPVSLGEMVEKLSISKGSASTNVRTLESWGAVRKVWVDNSRKDYYTANPDTASVITRRVKEGLTRRLEEVKRELGGIEEAVNTVKTQDENKKFYSERIKKVKDIYDSAMRFLSLLDGDTGPGK